jgi:hypothetical protein
VDAARLLDVLIKSGFKITPDPPVLRVSPKERLTDELRANLR